MHASPAVSRFLLLLAGGARRPRPIDLLHDGLAGVAPDGSGGAQPLGLRAG